MRGFPHQSSSFYIIFWIYVTQPTLSYPSPPLDPMLFFLCLSHCPPHTKCFSSLMARNTCPTQFPITTDSLWQLIPHNNQFLITTSVTSSFPNFSLSSTFGIVITDIQCVLNFGNPHPLVNSRSFMFEYGHCPLPKKSFYCMLYHRMNMEIYVYLFNINKPILEMKEKAK